MTLPKITPAIKAAWKDAPRCPHCKRKAAVEQTDKGVPLAYVCGSDHPRAAKCDAWRLAIKTGDLCAKCGLKLHGGKAEADGSGWCRMCGPTTVAEATAGEVASRGTLGANIITSPRAGRKEGTR